MAELQAQILALKQQQDSIQKQLQKKAARLAAPGTTAGAPNGELPEGSRRARKRAPTPEESSEEDDEVEEEETLPPAPKAKRALAGSDKTAIS